MAAGDTPSKRELRGVEEGVEMPTETEPRVVCEHTRQTHDKCIREGAPRPEDGVEVRCRFDPGRHEDEEVLIRS